jgi:DNA replication protein DnaC
MYNLGTLNDKDFEELCKDLLEKELNVKFQNFKRGSDNGIDLRYSADVENKIVVQAKHYQATKFSKFKSDLFKTEKKNMEDLSPQPERYIVFTSLSLSPKQTTEIFEGMKPFIKNTNDIYSRDRIYALLRNNEEIVKKHYKLWLTSTDVLLRIINNATNGRTEFYEEKILKNISLYVPTRKYSDAIKKLKKNKFIIITGQPGIGKTTISYLMICDLLAKGYQLVYIQNKISEGEQEYSPNPQKKQVFFFNDFLGANHYEIMNPRNSESSIVGFIERIQSSKNKFLILNTRTTILNQAEHNFEQLRREKFSQVSKYEIALQEYSKLDKAKILYNHLYHLSPAKINLLRTKKHYRSIIQHRNYSPRLIEFITNEKHFQQSDQKNYLTFIQKTLDNPSEIWKSAYETQLLNYDRFLLETLFSLGGYFVSRHSLQTAFDSRVAYEIKNNGIALENSAFEIVLSKLLDGFIKSERTSQDSLFFSLLNPSIGDFLINYLTARKKEKWRIIHSAIYFEQFTEYFHPNTFNYIPFDKTEIDLLYSVFNKISGTLAFSNLTTYPKSKSLEILMLYFSYFKSKVQYNIIRPWVEDLKLDNISTAELNKTFSVMEGLADFPEFRPLIEAQWNNYVSHLFNLARSESDFENTKLLFVLYDQDFDKYLSKEQSSKLVASCLNNIFIGKIEDDPLYEPSRMSSIMERIHEDDRSGAEEIILETLRDQFSDFITEVGMDDHFPIIFDEFRVDESSILDKAIENHTVEDYDYDGTITHDDRKSDDELTEIDRLFEK